MLSFKRINRQYIVTHNNVEYVLPEHKLAWALIFELRKDSNNE
jgi:hypothetical protein